jgi:hypothetical protein
VAVRKRKMKEEGKESIKKGGGIGKSGEEDGKHRD